MYIGWAGGVLCCILMSIICGGTNMILCAYADKHKATNYQTLVREFMIYFTIFNLNSSGRPLNL